MAAGFVSISDALLQPDVPVVFSPGNRADEKLALDVIERVFGIRFGIFDFQLDDWRHPPTDQPKQKVEMLGELCQSVAGLGRPEIIVYEDPLALLALPLVDSHENGIVAIGTFVTRPLDYEEDFSRAAKSLGLTNSQVTVEWVQRQTPWSLDAITGTADLVIDHLATLERLDQTEQVAENLSEDLAAAREEIDLLHRLTQHLKISKSDKELARIALDWISDVLPAKSLAIQFQSFSQQEETHMPEGHGHAELITLGQCPTDLDQFAQLLDYLDLAQTPRSIVVNRKMSSRPDWPLPAVRQMIAVPLTEGENTFGWLAAFNHGEDEDFGTIEASLLSSVAAIMGIHSGNIELYRQQAELLENVVQALTSAIDAKDPYTHGHSDRVAQVCVCLAEELGCDPETLRTMYLSGLLHDVGKIGIDDTVLRKPGSLTDDEYDHIKTHVGIGHKILADLKKLDRILPVVLHHHESWDGKGYPNGLPGEAIPLVARIASVADAFDAMGSDRPYRKRMPDEKVDAILRAGAGKQWDPTVVGAFFRRREEIRQIMQVDQKRAQPTEEEVTRRPDQSDQSDRPIRPASDLQT